MRETLVQSLSREDPLEKEMATHSSILARRIPWTEELGGLQSTGRKESDTTERLHFHFISAIVYSDSSTTVGVLEHSQGWGAESESFLTSLLLNHRF